MGLVPSYLQSAARPSEAVETRKIYNQVHVSGAADEIDHMAIRVVLKHFKCLPKTKISHHIEGQVVAPVRHVLRNAPLPFLTRFRRRESRLRAKC